MSTLISVAAMTSVAVAVNGGPGSRGNGSRRAVRWAVENLSADADTLILIHVMPAITSIPTPSGEQIPINELDANVVELYVQDMRAKFEQIFLPFKKLCKTLNVETLVLEGKNPATVLLRYASESGIKSLVLGSCFSNCILRKLRGPGVPSTVLRYAPDTCDVYVISRRRLRKKSTNPSSFSKTSSRHWFVTRRKLTEGPNGINEQISGSSTLGSKVRKIFGASSLSELSFSSSQAFTHQGSTNASIDQESYHQNLGDNNQETLTVKVAIPWLLPKAEVEKLRLELQDAVSMYERACEELVHTQSKVQILSSECIEERRKVNAALEREGTFRKIASEEKAKHLETMEEVEVAKNLLAIEVNGRQIAELHALKESSEKQKIVDELFSSDKRYRKYTKDEIEVATDFFSESRVIGEGGYGKVYKGNLDHTPVAVRLFILMHVEVLSHLRHPHMVLLLGACPESGCLVYEYMENGSLDKHIFHQDRRMPLPWFVRFQIIFEVACGLAFLHSSKPEPIVHRDLKPGNILLDRNYVSKIGDVGLAKLISDTVPDNITEYRDSILAGTLFYMDPEYQRTGTIRPKSDVYAFGVIILQLLAARHPNGLILTVENAITNGTFADTLDKSITDWPIAETEELACLALKCSKLRCRDRPDLETEVLPVLKDLQISQMLEVMEDPHIAADGFTYEHRAIKAWLDRHDVSPVTKWTFQHKMLTPNQTLRSAIQEWRCRVESSSN
ncbi:U-box domain-containing protein 34 [Vitis vinifera]|uniref:U-box domain-containing protein 34 n=1 Tax=Vitis vinifera TaxID=29760 RepID=A0A438J8Q6_VITVI|nr:U-box domain-containing protein 34 [Vitis vinifera]